MLETALNSYSNIPDCNECFLGIFGAGNTTALNINSFERLNIHPCFYIDNSTAKQGTSINDTPVVSLEAYINKANQSKKKALILICSANIDIVLQIKKQLSTLNISAFTTVEYIFCKNRDKILKTYDLFEDEQSQNLYYQLILFRLKNLQLPMELITPNQYFCIPQFINEDKSEVFVDVGAFVGDTLEQYLWSKMGVFKKIYAFEPDTRNYNALCFRTERLKREWAVSDEQIILENAAVGIENSNISVAPSNPNGSSLGAIVNKSAEAENTLPMYSIDHYFSDDKISFLKADIESYEYDMLLGAQKVIQRDHPKIAVCIYHGAADLFDIPLLIQHFSDSYHFIIRQHRVEGFSETVLYIY